MQCTTYLIEVMGLPLSAQQSALPQTRTEGWILAHLLLGGYLVSSLAGRAREPDHGAGRHRTYRASLPISSKKSPRNYSFWVLACLYVVSYASQRYYFDTSSVNERHLGAKSDANLPDSSQGAARSALVSLVYRTDGDHQGERRDTSHGRGC